VSPTRCRYQLILDELAHEARVPTTDYGLVRDAIIGDIRSANRTAARAAIFLGRKGGKATSEAKATAARENGKRGGRPRKTDKE
jgi:hypothetical protein